jgi:hypothetical protein
MLVQQMRRNSQIELFNEDHQDAFRDFRLRPPEIVHGVLERVRAPIALFKPIKDTYLTSNFLAEYPNSQAIFIYRAYPDVINSAVERFYVQQARRKGIDIDSILPPVDRWMDDDFAIFDQAPPPLELRVQIRALWQPELNRESKIALHWLFQNSLYFLLDLDTDPRVHLIRYESLVEHPKHELQQLCRYLDIDYNDRMSAGIHAKSIARRPASSLASEVENACQDMLERLNSLSRVQLNESVWP